MPTSNINDLRDELLKVFDGLREGRIEDKFASEINNTAGKIISTVKLQLAHAALCGTTPNIPFLGEPGEPAGALPGSTRALASSVGAVA